MPMKRKRTIAGSLSPSSSSSSSKFDDCEIYLLYSLYDSPVRYVMYKLDTSAIGNDDDGGGNNLRRIPNCTPVFELPSEEYPRAMGSFALGSRIYLLGGEVERHRGVDIVCSGGRDTIYLSEKVYFYDIAVSSSSSSPLSVAPPMGGGKKSPLAIQANGLVYVISDLPGTYYSETEPLFEVFNPQGGNESEGEWSSLPRPPFYPRSCYNLSEGKRVLSHAVVGQLIYFFTAKKHLSYKGVEAVYTFDVLSCHWEHLDYYKTGNSKPPLRGAVMQVSDSAWAGLSSYPGDIRSPISTFDLSANFGVVGRGVEGLEFCCPRMPPQAYGISYHLLDMRNGWFCLLKFGTVNETMPPYALRVLGDMGGIRALDKRKKYISASVFRLVKRRKDKVSFCESRESGHWRGRTLLAPSDIPRDVSKAVGEIQVFGAEELRSSLFATGVESFNASYHLVGFFAM
ncbi:hypothetical protein Vadar_029641 [Vaccinium darrowii]|uniref:Uncharacterized protein n=1 Tax=Vaccinium darrowii TaxID=229202 RepID=A0ACB7YQP2_9ERIC|nr:hypothetical protein Vadar_029641 [Vaccinium darrowii]